MKFEELRLPVSVPKEGLTPKILSALELYNQIDASHYFNLNERSDQNEVLDIFSSRVAYVATNHYDSIKGVAYFLSENNIGQIEGVSTADRRKQIGSFIVSNLINLATHQRLEAIELTSTKDALDFWVKQGFDPTGDHVEGQHVPMRLELTNKAPR